VLQNDLSYNYNREDDENGDFSFTVEEDSEDDEEINRGDRDISEFENRTKNILKESRETRLETLKCPVKNQLNCSNNTDDNIMDHIMALPPEVKIIILRNLDIEDLLRLDLSPSFLHSLLRLPEDVIFEHWLRRKFDSEDLGLICVSTGNKTFIAHDSLNVHNFNFIEDSYDSGTNLKMYPICPEALTPGIYKVRILQDGFDLAPVGINFLSSQCGLEACFHDADDQGWTTSFKARGFSIHIEESNALGGIWDSEEIWKLPLKKCHGYELSSYSYSPSVFLISLEEEWWLRPWHHRRRKNYSIDRLAYFKKEEDENFVDCYDGERFHGLGVIVNPGGAVVAYTISGGGLFYSYSSAAEGLPVTSFSVTRYHQSGGTGGLCLTGPWDSQLLHEQMGNVRR